MTDNLWLCGPCRHVPRLSRRHLLPPPPLIEECSGPLGDSIGHSVLSGGRTVIIAAVLGICLLYRKGGQKRQRFALISSPLLSSIAAPPSFRDKVMRINGRMVSAHQESILNMSPAVRSIVRLCL